MQSHAIRPIVYDLGHKIGVNVKAVALKTLRMQAAARLPWSNCLRLTLLQRWLCPLQSPNQLGVALLLRLILLLGLLLCYRVEDGTSDVVLTFKNIGAGMIFLIQMSLGLGLSEYAYTCDLGYRSSEVFCTIYYLLYVATSVILLLNLLIGKAGRR